MVQVTLSRFPRATANTYVCHPWCGWADQSIDFWGPAGRGDPIPADLGDRLHQFLLNFRGPPVIRHTIFQHQLWTSWGGYSVWRADDHAGRERHVHVTYY